MLFEGAYDKVTGSVDAFHSVIGGSHSEEMACAVMPNSRLTQPMGWRQPRGVPSEEWTFIPVCVSRCQPQFPPALPTGDAGSIRRCVGSMSAGLAERQLRLINWDELGATVDPLVPD